MLEEIISIGKVPQQFAPQRHDFGLFEPLPEMGSSEMDLFFLAQAVVGLPANA